MSCAQSSPVPSRISDIRQAEWDMFQPLHDEAQTGEWKPNPFNDEETSYHTCIPEEWWPIDDLLGVNLMTQPDSPYKLPQTSDEHEPSSYPRYKPLLSETKVLQFIQKPPASSGIRTLPHQKPRTHSEKSNADTQLNNMDKPEHREQPKKHEMHLFSEGNAKQAELLSLHKSTAISKDHDYCFQPIRKGDFMNDSFIASCLLNPNLEEEVLKETEVMRRISKQGLSNATSGTLNLLFVLETQD